MLWRVLRFVLVLLTVIVGTHGVLYLSVVRFFGIESARFKISLVAGLSVLALGLVVASVAVHVVHNGATRALYAVAALWYGLLVYLLIASALIWLIEAVRWLAPAVLPERMPWFAAVGLYGAALLFVIYGFSNAFAIRSNRIDLPVANLPAPWRGKTVVQLSDLHLGGFWGRSLVRRVATEIDRLRPEVVVITGDLFDGAAGHHQQFVTDLKRIRAERGVYFVSGNHEFYSRVDESLAAVKAAGFHVIDDDVLDLDGLLLVGMAFAGNPKAAEPFALASHPAFDRAKPSILLYHTPTDIGERGTHSREPRFNAYLTPNTDFATARDLGITLQLSGHTHAGQFLPFVWLAKRIFRGFHAGLHHLGDFRVYVHSGTGTWGPPLRSGCVSEIALFTLREAGGRQSSAGSSRTTSLQSRK